MTPEEFIAPLKDEDPEFRAFVETLPANLWARYDLSALHLGWYWGRQAFEKCADGELFEDGLSADLQAEGIKTLPEAYMAGRQDFINEVRYLAQERT